MKIPATVLALFFALPLWAGVLVGEAPEEQRVRHIAAELRCPVCQSENILDSQSGTAREMLDLVREQVAAGRTESEIMDFFQARYGNYVLLSPPAAGAVGVIWLVPVLLLVAGAGLGLVLVMRMRAAREPLPGGARLTKARLEELDL